MNSMAVPSRTIPLDSDTAKHDGGELSLRVFKVVVDRFPYLGEGTMAKVRPLTAPGKRSYPFGTSRLTDYGRQTHRDSADHTQQERKDAISCPFKLLPRTSVSSCGFFFSASVRLSFLNSTPVGRSASPRSSESGVIKRRVLELTSPAVSLLRSPVTGHATHHWDEHGLAGVTQPGEIYEISPGDDRVRCVVGGFQEITKLTFRGPVPQQ
jgi:hypothetical protein